MNAAEKAAFVDRIRKAEADAAKQGRRLTGYTVEGTAISFSSVPIKPRRAKADDRPTGDSPPRRVVKRGAAQGSLL